MSDPEVFNNLLVNYGNYSIPLAVLIASLAGSTHCVSMCSPVSIIVRNRDGNLFLYHAGRLLSYLILGGLAGFLGDRFLNSGYQYISVLSVVGVSVFLVYAGFRIVTGNSVHLAAPAGLTSYLYIPLKWAFKRSRLVMSVSVGVVNGFIPCGWVYLFILGAVATADPFYGALLISFFWLGTVPALTVFTLFSERLFWKLPKTIYKTAGVLLIVTGVLNIGYHLLHDHGIHGSPHSDTTIEHTVHGKKHQH